MSINKIKDFETVSKDSIIIFKYISMMKKLSDFYKKIDYILKKLEINNFINQIDYLHELKNISEEFDNTIGELQYIYEELTQIQIKEIVISINNNKILIQQI